MAALIHAGPDAALSHATAAWWWGILAEEPVLIEVSSRSRVRSSQIATVISGCGPPGCLVIRYSWAQVAHDPDAVLTDLSVAPRANDLDSARR